MFRVSRRFLAPRPARSLFAVFAVVAPFALFAVVAGCGSDGRTLSAPGPDQTLSIVTTTTAPQAGTGSMAMGTAWNTGEPIPEKFACTTKGGQDISPVVSWGLVPQGTTELALVMTDRDSAPAGGFVHWVIIGIPITSNGIAENGAIPGTTVLTNEFGRVGYGGPCPPDDVAHTYELTLFALQGPSGLAADVAARTAVQTLETQAIDQVTITGTFTP